VLYDTKDANAGIELYFKLNYLPNNKDPAHYLLPLMSPTILQKWTASFQSSLKPLRP
jgi:hypothetical protein